MTTSDARNTGLASAGWLADDAAAESAGETVGASDAEADAIRAGADDDLSETSRDSDGVPVGEADVAADIERAGGDPDDVR